MEPKGSLDQRLNNLLHISGVTYQLESYKKIHKETSENSLKIDLEISP